MKLSPKDKNVLLILLSILLLAGALLLLLYPELTKYPYSLKSLKEKKSSTEEYVDKLAFNESSILQKSEIYQKTEADAKKLQIESDNLMLSFPAEILEYDFASVLISIEEKARECDVDLLFHFKEIYNSEKDQSGFPDDYEDYEDYDELEDYKDNSHEHIDDEIQEDSPDINGQDGDLNEIEKAESIKESHDSRDQEMQAVDGEKTTTDDEKNKENSDDEIDNNKTAEQPFPLDNEDWKTDVDNYASSFKNNITVIPIEFKGRYSNIRRFLNSLDEIDMLEPGRTYLSSEGDNIHGVSLVYVFYKGGE